MAAANSAYLLTFILLYEGTGPTRRWCFLMLHTALVGTLVTPSVQIVALLRPRWILAHGLLITPAAMFVVSCFLLEESPAWLIAKWRLREAEEGVLLAAKINGQDVDHVRAGFRVLTEELGKLKNSLELMHTSSPSEAILEAMRMRRRAVAAFFSRFTLSGVYFGLVVSEKTSGYFLQAASIVMSTTVYVSIVWALSRCGVRETLSAVLAITCCIALTKSLVMLNSDTTVTPFVDAAMKAVAAGSVSVVMCYAGETFPTNIRSVGISLSMFFGGLGSLVGIFITKVKSEPEGIHFNMYAAVMTMLSIVVVQWLPEVFIQKPVPPPENILSPEERKVALQASLPPIEVKKSRSYRKGKATVAQQ
ncbi:hypothetical protein V5799_013389 [Amblyomma americanum]|uniref:Uncharacterized protein n=1 Tax=Amblyomma americanum TaxID=6943 RepID=A0AAQ4E604_AMBAM